MSADVDNPVPEPPSLAGAPWLATPWTRAVLEALAVAGFEGRVVGGSVRNALMGLAVSDIDIATPAEPNEVMQACRAAGLQTVPTGLDHGTVTVIAHHTAVEVTTLRRDVATDGRHAVVAFAKDWAEDAQRRDFTMNALYCDRTGRLYDYVGGWPDLVQRRIRFIGDADQRIAEDYLRILRFFRFHAAFGQGEPDREALAACARGVAGMARLSAERVRAELVKLLVAPGAVSAVGAMEDIGLLSMLLGTAPRPDLLAAVVDSEADFGVRPDAMLRLSGLAIAATEDIAKLAARLRLSNDERKALLVIDLQMAQALGTIDERRARQLVYQRGAEACRRLAIALAAIEPRRKDEAAVLLATAASWQPPSLSVTGADVLARGVMPGPRVGQILRELQDWWANQDFPGPAETLAHLENLIAAARSD